MNLRPLFLSIALMGVTGLRAQHDGSSGTLKAGAGYTYNFPGMAGYTIIGEYIFPLTDRFEGGLGAKIVDLNGHPRTPTVGEYVKAKTLDFNMYWMPLQSDTRRFRIGLGYSFSFYDTRSSYPLIVQSGGKSTTQWPVADEKGNTRGINLIAEYEYIIPDSPLSIGLRAALYKASDGTYFVGPILGYRL